MGKKTAIIGFIFAASVQLGLASNIIDYADRERGNRILPITPAAAGDLTTVNFDSGGTHMIFDNPSLHGGSDVALSGGSTADGDGFVLQLGYFTGPSFTGTFVPLSGEGSLNTAIIPGSIPPETYNHTSIGDLTINGAGNGTFALTLNFIVGSGTSDNNLPAAGTLLALRFYNGTTIASSTFYNTVTASAWAWAAPATPPSVVNISLNDTLQWESIVLYGQGAGSAFHTTILVPEPSTWSLLALGGLGSLGMTWLRARHRVRTTRGA